MVSDKILNIFYLWFEINSWFAIQNFIETAVLIFKRYKKYVFGNGYYESIDVAG